MKKYSICIFLCGMLLAGCNSEKELSQIKIPEEKIAKFQMGSIGSKPEEYKHLSDLIEDMEEAVPEKDQKKAPHRGEDYYPVSFIYEDETKDIFYFFPEGEKWYLETENGDVYGNADFILDYVDIDFNVDVKREIRIDKDVLKRSLEIGKDFKTYDTNFFFANGVVNRMEITGDTEEDAISKERKSSIDSRKVYEYAKKFGYEVSEKEVEERIKKILEDFNEQEDYPEYEAICKEYGITMEECLEKSRDYIKEEMTKNKLSLETYKDFQNGKDKIKDKTYETPYEYSRAILDEVVYTEISDEDIASYIQELDEAEAYYLENF
ncbi:hypothetical protein [Blautia sp. Marseille-P3201T]|uniref:hypothetical protein n=1 Tax=Blautia sp. Marseille-P3201T TaxID=1907659 RepID=UPI000930354C|nr:hypothetical protein [Blautia sp. Marseille-P3201T]